MSRSHILRFLCWFNFWIVTAILSAQQVSPPLEGEHGTCAIVLANNDDMALIVDSRLTRTGSTKSCVEDHPQGCKAVLVRKDILLAVTGVYNDPVAGTNWKVADETKQLLLKLPKALEKSDLDKFLADWFPVLVTHFRQKSNLGLNKGVEVSTVIVATKIHKVPYIYRAVISLNRAGYFATQGEFLLVDDSAQLFYAGSCRDNIGTHPEGFRIPALDPPNALYQWELNELRYEQLAANSVSQFVPLLQKYEKVFEMIGESKDKCWIGPPYDIATWSKGEAGWATNFKADCSEPASKTRRPRHTNEH